MTDTKSRVPWLFGLLVGLIGATVWWVSPAPRGLAGVAYHALCVRGYQSQLSRLPCDQWLENPNRVRSDARGKRLRIHRRSGQIVSDADVSGMSARERNAFGTLISGSDLLWRTERAAMSVLGIGWLMAAFWIFGTLPIAITALLPLLLFPTLGVASLTAPSFPGYFVVSTQYAHHLIFLFMGTFIASRGISVWKLDEHIAYRILKICGRSPRLFMLGLIVSAAAISMWITNTATTAMLVPTAIAVLDRVDHPEADRFATGVLLSIAYAATVGGIGTLVGTAPNAIYATFSASLLGRDVTFVEWMSFGLPFVLFFLPML